MLQGRSSESQLQTEVQVVQEGLANAQADARRWREEAQQQVRPSGRSWLGAKEMLFSGPGWLCCSSDMAHTAPVSPP